MTTLQNGLNLAYWLYKVHPELYARVLPLARQAKGLGSLGDDIGTTTTFDTGSTFDDSSVLSTITPDIATISTPDLANVSVDTSGFTTPTFQTEADPTSSVWDAIGSDLKSVGSWLTSAPGLSSLSSIATTVIKANTPQQATVQTQVQRVAAGSNPAAITYGLNTSGQVVPILTTGTNAGVGLTFQTLQKLVPPAYQAYVVPALIAGVAWLLLRRRRR